MITPSFTTPIHLGSRLLPLALGAALLLSLTPPAAAQQLAWDTNPAVAGLGGLGNWNINPGGTANWTLNLAGTGPNIIWPNTAGTDALFAGAASTVTLTSPGVQVRNIEISANYLINGAQTLTLAPNSHITLTGVINAAINTPLAGLGFIKDGSGDNQLDLRGVSTLTNGVTVQQGQIKLSLGGKITDVSLVVSTSASADFIASVLIDGPTSKWTNTGAVVIGGGGDAYLTLRNGGQLDGGTGSIAVTTGVKATVTVTDAGSTWTNNGLLRVGSSGEGTLMISNDGDVLATRSVIGEEAGSFGLATVTGSGSTWTNSADLDVGGVGTGQLNVFKAGKVTSVNGVIGQNPGSSGTAIIDGTASKWTMTGSLFVGDSGTGILRVENDGDVISNKGFIGTNSGSHATATVTGVGSTWTIADDLIVGDDGTGTFNVTNGGVVTDGAGYLGKGLGSTGVATVSGAGSSWTNNAFLIVGGDGLGTLDILTGGSVTALGAGLIGDGATGVGTVTVDGVGSIWKVGTGGGYRLTVGGNNQGTLRILNGGTVIAGENAVIGSNSNGVGTATVDGAGSKWTITNDLVVGDDGTGTFNVTNGGVVTNVAGYLGKGLGSTGAATVSGAGSSWTNNAFLIVGGDGLGTLDILSGGSVTALGAGLIGDGTTGVGTVTVDGVGSIWKVGIGGGYRLTVGGNNQGTLRILNGGTVVSGADAVIGSNSNSKGTATVDGAGSKWTITTDLVVADDGTGLLTIRNGGAVSAVKTTVNSLGTIELGTAATLTSPQLIFAGGTLRTLASITIPNNAALVGAGVIVDSAGSNSTLTGIFSGGGGLTKIGDGRITLTAVHTYTGNTVINGGTLTLDGSLRSANVLVNPGGQLAGLGTAFGNVVNNGVFTPGHSPGTFTIGGNYTQQSGGVLVVEIAGKNPGQHDLVVVGGHAALDGTLRLVNVNGLRFKVGDKVPFLTAAGGVSGKFSTVENPFGSGGTIVSTEVLYHANEVALEVVQGSFAALRGLTPNQRAVAHALDRIAFDSRETKLVDFLNGEALGKLPADFDRIAPEELASIFNLSAALANVQTANLQRRMDELRAGASGFSAQGLALSGSAGSASGGFGLAGPAGKGGKMLVPAEDNRWGVFVTGVGEVTRLGDTDNARGYDLRTGGFTLGVDCRLTPHFALGVTAGYARTGIDLNHGGSITVDGGKLGLYATYFDGGFYVDAAVSGGLNAYATSRAALRGAARGSEDGGEFDALLATGYDWKRGGLTVGPTANLQYTNTSLGGFTERGSLAPLRYGAQHGESLRTALGAKASYDWKVGGVLIRPEVRAAWQHEFGDSAYGLTSSFANGGGGTFTTAGPEAGDDRLLVGAGFAVQWSARTSTYVYYDGEFGRSNYRSDNVSAGFRLAF